MALVTGGITAKEVKVLSAFDVPYENPFTAVDCHGQASVIVAHLGQVQVNDILCSSAERSSSRMRAQERQASLGLIKQHHK